MCRIPKHVLGTFARSTPRAARKNGVPSLWGVRMAAELTGDGSYPAWAAASAREAKRENSRPGRQCFKRSFTATVRLPVPPGSIRFGKTLTPERDGDCQYSRTTACLGIRAFIRCRVSWGEGGQGLLPLEMLFRHSVTVPH